MDPSRMHHSTEICKLQVRVDVLSRKINEHVKAEQSAETPHEKACTSRDGESWTRFEREIIADKILALCNQYSTAFGRTFNAIMWEIYRQSKVKKQL